MNFIKEGSVLILGDGNLSFSRSFKSSSSSSSTEAVATVFETEETLCSLFPSASDHISYLRQCSGAKVEFDVDATDLANCVLLCGQTFDHIIFNFPHAGGKMNLRKCRTLLAGLFKSCRSKLKHDGRLYLTFAAGQSGLNLYNSRDPKISWFPRHEKGSWKVIYLAAYENFILENVYPFNANDFQGYECTGFRSDCRPFRTEGAQTMVFRQTAELTLTLEKAQAGLLHQLRPFYVHDIAFTTINEVFPEKFFRSEVGRLSRGLVKKIMWLFEHSFRCNRTNLDNVCYRVVWQAWDSALTGEQARDLQLKLRLDLTEVFRNMDIPFVMQ